MNVNYNFEGKVAIVVGGADGIGLETSKILAEAGAKVLISDFNKEKGEQAAKELKDQGYVAEFCFTDIRSKDSIFGMVDKAVELWGRIDYAANVAGIFSKSGPFLEHSDESYDNVVTTNLTGHWWLLQAQIKQMLAQGGEGYAIVEVASIQGLIASPGGPDYTAAKHGVVGLVKALGGEFAKNGIRINGIAPVATATALVKKHYEQLGIEFDNRTDRVPRGTMLEPEECAHSIVWLLSDGASAINAITLPVDGGATSIK